MISAAGHVKSVPRHAVKSLSVYHAKIRINLKNESLGRHFLLQREGRDREDRRGGWQRTTGGPGDHRGRHAGLSSGAHATEISLGHLVAFQHAIFHSIYGGDGIHRFGNFQTPTVSLRKGAYAFYDRLAAVIRAASCWWECQKLSDEGHSERSET